MKWEYQTVKLGVAGTWGVKFDADEAQNVTNDLGAEGWELVRRLPLMKAPGIQKKSSLFLSALVTNNL